jgi:diacylglycerol kinase
MTIRSRLSFNCRLRSFRYALNGIKILFLNEPNALIHIVVLVFALVAGIILKISTTEWCLIAIVSGFVLATEAINTSVERVADFVHPDRHEKIKAIKDLAAAAVLLSAITAFIVGLLVFLPKILLFVKGLN